MNLLKNVLKKGDYNREMKKRCFFVRETEEFVIEVEVKKHTFFDIVALL